MAYPKIDRWPSTLADSDGIWCAVCFRTIPPTSQRKADVVDQHHVVSKAPLERMFSPGPNPAHRWTVPVCPSCHTNAAAQADAAAKTLIAACQSDRRSFDAWVRAQHDQGEYSRSLIAKLYFLKTSKGSLDPNEYAVVVEHAIATASGVAWARGNDLTLLNDARLFVRPGYLLNRANYAAAFGGDKNAMLWLEAAVQRIGELPRARRGGFEGSKKRRFAQILLDVDAAKEAVYTTKDKYERSTAMMLQGGIPCVQGRDSQARDAVLDYLALSERPVFYDALAFFIQAITDLHEGVDRQERTYLNLVKAQYTVTMLGLNPRLPFSSSRAGLIPADLTAGALLCSDAFGEIPPMRRKELREEALGLPGNPSPLWSRVNEVLTS